MYLLILSSIITKYTNIDRKKIKHSYFFKLRHRHNFKIKCCKRLKVIVTSVINIFVLYFINGSSGLQLIKYVLNVLNCVNFTVCDHS